MELARRRCGDGLGWDGFAAETGIKLFFFLAVRGPGPDLVRSHTVVAGRMRRRRGRAGGGGRERDERRSPSAHKRAAAAMIA